MDAEDVCTSPPLPIDDHDTNEAALAAAAAAVAAAAATVAEVAPAIIPAPPEPPEPRLVETSPSKKTTPMKRKLPIEMETSTLPSLSPPNSTKTKQNRYKHRLKFPVPESELIIGYRENDVLFGRGATINCHPGNTHFRNVCASRKPEFDVSTNAQKRQIAIEVVENILNLVPPGRFIERTDIEDSASVNIELLKNAVGDKAADVHRLLLDDHDCDLERGTVAVLRKKDKKLKKQLGPWRDVGIERAIQKACGVIRDHNRPDRIALRAMGMLTKKPPHGEGGDIDAMMVAEATANHVLATPAHTFDIIPTDNDVIIGRGAFINEHPGNRKFRQLAIQRKVKFNGASPSEKRSISLELVLATKALEPPGRFIKRASHALSIPIPLENGKYQLPPRGLEGPWEEVGEDKALSKACQVMRDLKLKPEERIELEVNNIGDYVETVEPLKQEVLVPDVLDTSQDQCEQEEEFVEEGEELNHHQAMPAKLEPADIETTNDPFQAPIAEEQMAVESHTSVDV